MEHLDLIVVHGYHQPETTCLHGETVEQAYLSFRGRDFPLHLSATGLLIVDCLCRYHLTPLTAVRLERILALDPFYRRLGANAPWAQPTTIRPRRDSIRVYIQRIRVQIGKALREAGVNVTPGKVLVSETTDSNVVVYQLKVGVEIRHRQR